MNSSRSSAVPAAHLDGARAAARARGPGRARAPTRRSPSGARRLARRQRSSARVGHHRAVGADALEGVGVPPRPEGDLSLGRAAPRSASAHRVRPRWRWRHDHDRAVGVEGVGRHRERRRVAARRERRRRRTPRAPTGATSSRTRRRPAGGVTSAFTRRWASSKPWSMIASSASAAARDVLVERLACARRSGGAARSPRPAPWSGACRCRCAGVRNPACAATWRSSAARCGPRVRRRA